MEGGGGKVSFAIHLHAGLVRGTGNGGESHDVAVTCVYHCRIRDEIGEGIGVQRGIGGDLQTGCVNRVAGVGNASALCHYPERKGGSTGTDVGIPGDESAIVRGDMDRGGTGHQGGGNGAGIELAADGMRNHGTENTLAEVADGDGVAYGGRGLRYADNTGVIGDVV